MALLVILMAVVCTSAPIMMNLCFFVNADQIWFWSNGQSQVLRQKSLGASIIVSDFIVEGHGYLCHDKKVETQKDGYFNSDVSSASIK